MRPMCVRAQAHETLNQCVDTQQYPTTPPEDSASSVHRGGGAAARAQVGEAVNDPLYEAWNCRKRCGLRAKVSRLEGGRAVGREGRGAGDPPLERRLLSDILTCVFDLW